MTRHFLKLGLYWCVIILWIVCAWILAPFIPTGKDFKDFMILIPAILPAILTIVVISSPWWKNKFKPQSEDDYKNGLVESFVFTVLLVGVCSFGLSMYIFTFAMPPVFKAGYPYMAQGYSLSAFAKDIHVFLIGGFIFGMWMWIDEVIKQRGPRWLSWLLWGGLIGGFALLIMMY